MFGYVGDDLAVFALCISLGVPFGWDAVKEKGVRRYVAGTLCAVLIAVGLFWFAIKANAPSLAAAAVTIATSLQTWVSLGLIAVAIFFLTSPSISGSSQPLKPAYAPRFEPKTPAPLPPPRTIPEQQFEIEIRKFVLSRLESVLSGYFDVTWGDMQNRYLNSDIPLKEHKMFNALSSCVGIAHELGVRELHSQMKFLLTQQPVDLTKLQTVIIRFMHEYRRTKAVGGDFLRATGLQPNAELFKKWTDAEENCLNALNDLRASPLATGEFRGCPTNALVEKLWP